MIKPDVYWAMHKHTDPYTLGRIGATLGGQEVDPPLNLAEQAMVATVREASEWYDERLQAKRDADKARIAAKRAARQGVADVANVAATNAIPATHAGARVTPSVRPSVHPSCNNINNINTVSDTVSDKVTARDESARNRIRNRDKKSSGKDWWGMEEDELRYATESMVAILTEALGSGAWRKAVQQAGDEAVKELFLVFRAECRAGEHPDNPAAAFTRRLQTDLKVDFARK